RARSCASSRTCPTAASSSPTASRPTPWRSTPAPSPRSAPRSGALAWSLPEEQTHHRGTEDKEKTTPRRQVEFSHSETPAMGYLPFCLLGLCLLCVLCGESLLSAFAGAGPAVPCPPTILRGDRP